MENKKSYITVEGDMVRIKLYSGCVYYIRKSNIAGISGDFKQYFKDSNRKSPTFGHYVLHNMTYVQRINDSVHIPCMGASDGVYKAIFAGGR